MMLDTFRCNAIDLCRPEMQDVGFWLRLDGDSEDPNAWHEVDTITEHFGGGIDMLTVTFRDGTDEKVFNETGRTTVYGFSSFLGQFTQDSARDPTLRVSLGQ